MSYAVYLPSKSSLLCWLNVGPSSTTLTQHSTDIEAITALDGWNMCYLRLLGIIYLTDAHNM